MTRSWEIADDGGTGRTVLDDGFWILRLDRGLFLHSGAVIVLLSGARQLCYRLTDWCYELVRCCFSANKQIQIPLNWLKLLRRTAAKLQRRWFAATAQLISETANVFLHPKPGCSYKRLRNAILKYLGAQLCGEDEKCSGIRRVQSAISTASHPQW